MLKSSLEAMRNGQNQRGTLDAFLRLPSLVRRVVIVMGLLFILPNILAVLSFSTSPMVSIKDSKKSKWSRTLQPLHTLNDPQLDGLSNWTWVKRRNRGKYSLDRRYWGKFGRSEPVLRLNFAINTRRWKKRSLRNRILRMSAIRKKRPYAHAGSDLALETRFGSIPAFAFSISTDRQTRDCIGYSSYMNKRQTLYGYACARPGEEVDRQAIACLLNKVHHPGVMTAQPANRQPCPQFSTASASNSETEPNEHASPPFEDEPRSVIRPGAARTQEDRA